MTISQKDPSKNSPALDFASLAATLTDCAGSRLAALMQADQRQRWLKGQRILAEAYFEHLPALRADREAFLDFLYAEILLREEMDETPTLDEYVRRFPQHETALRKQFDLHKALQSKVAHELETPAPEDAKWETLNTPPGSSAAAPAPPEFVPEAENVPKIPTQFGRYRIVKLLGRGGMGAVYLAEDTELQRRVALKIPDRRFLEHSTLQARFQEEARAAATLSHPNICPVYDVGNFNGLPYICMAYVEGQPLTDQIKKRKVFPPREAAELVRKIALALEEAHQHGITHRDLKPSNIIINLRGEPIVMDFGLALRGKPGAERLTQEGEMVGTPAYMPPEQIRGDLTAMGPRSDIYSLGVLFYELLAGEPPFRGSMFTVLARILNEQPVQPSSRRPDIDKQLEAICAHAMAKPIEERYGSMAEFAHALGGYLRHGPAA